MVVGKNHRSIKIQVEHLRRSAFPKIVNNKKLLTAFTNLQPPSRMFNQVPNTPLKTAQYIQCLKFICECLMQILTQFLIESRVFHVKERIFSPLQIISFLVSQKILKSNCSDIASHPFIFWHISIVNCELLFGESDSGNPPSPPEPFCSGRGGLCLQPNFQKGGA